MLITGNQLRAARALAGVDQAWVAQVSGVSVNTVRNMEGRGAGEITSGAVLLRQVQSSLELLGIEFTNGGSPGVRLRFVEARAHQRDSGEWVVLIRWKDGDPLVFKEVADAVRIADSAARAGDSRVPNALRKAAEDALRNQFEIKTIAEVGVTVRHILEGHEMTFLIVTNEDGLRGLSDTATVRDGQGAHSPDYFGREARLFAEFKARAAGFID